jgi:hypothetical protein
MKYNYEIYGKAAGGQTWSTKGSIEQEQLGDFPSVPTQALIDSFNQLTEGKAVYGQPGLGCEGPYTIKRMLIEQVDN